MKRGRWTGHRRTRQTPGMATPHESDPSCAVAHGDAPPEPVKIAIATLAGLIADRDGRPGGFEF